MTSASQPQGRPVALVTGVGRTAGLGAGIARQLVNARATWLLIREYGQRFLGEPGTGRIISLTSEIRTEVIRRTPAGRLGTPQDTAHLVDFLCSPQGGWINGQLLMSNGGSS
jgi:NAD(P)-dependent dehydrogenase (short-subunit alcohol dehydrogenase family)